MPHAGAGGSGAPRLRRPQGPKERRADLSGPGARQRAVLAEPRSGEPVSHSDLALQVACICRPELGLEVVRFQRPAGLRVLSQIRGEARSDHECHQPGPPGVPRSAAASCCSITAGTTSSSRRSTASITTRACSHTSAAGAIGQQRSPTCRASTGCSWRRAWRIAAAAPGRTVFDMQAVLERWIEQGTAPERIVATRAINGVVDRARPLCAYPQVAVYRGTGDTNDAASFECRAR